MYCVKFEEWFPHYQDIRMEFGYSTEKDQEAAKLLSAIIKKRKTLPSILSKKINGKSVIVIGAGPSLEENLSFIKKNPKFIKIVADAAVKPILDNKIKPDIVVTDLDGDKSSLLKASENAIMVVHAHSDNIEQIKKLTPKFRYVIGSTQVKPEEAVYNFGGFTDGDRCVFLAEEFLANEIILVGMDFGKHIGIYSNTRDEDTETKISKLKVGKKLLQILAKKSRSKLYDLSENPIPGFIRYFH